MTNFAFSMPALLRPKKRRSPWPSVLWVLVPTALVLGVVALINTTVAVAAYAVAVVAISLWRPEVALMLAFALAPFTKELPLPGPLKISMGEFTLALCLPAFFIAGLSRIRFPAFLFFSILYLGACVFTMILNVDKGKDGISSMVQMVLYLIIAVLVYSSFVRDPAKFILILDGGLAVMAVLAILIDTGLGDGFELHKNSLGATMASAMLITLECWFASVHDKKRRLILLVLLFLFAGSLLWSLSRGAWLAAFAGTFVIVMLRRQFALMLRVLLVTLPLLIVLFFILPEEKQDYALSTDTTRVNYAARLEIIQNAYSTFMNHKWYGAGISYRKKVDATNIVFVSLAESGIIGLATFSLMNAAVLRSVWKTQKRIPRSHLLYSPVALGAALVIAHLTHGLVDHYWSRGPILQAWACAGMSAAVYYSLRERRKLRRPDPLHDFPEFSDRGAPAPFAPDSADYP